MEKNKKEKKKPQQHTTQEKALFQAKASFKIQRLPKDDMSSKTAGAEGRETGVCTVSNLASSPYVPVHLLSAPTTLCASGSGAPGRLPSSLLSLPLLSPSVLCSWLADKRALQMGFSCLPHKWHTSVKAEGRPWPGLSQKDHLLLPPQPPG